LRTHLHFDRRKWQLTADDLFFGDDGSAVRAGEGRGAAVFFEHNGQGFVRKHYQRGGWIRRIIRDRYVYCGLERTRMWREYRLLERMGELGLPVPEPVAVRCVCHGPFYYSGDLVTVRLGGMETLESLLKRGPLSSERWAEVGATLARFHRHSVYHADLNSANIMLGERDAVALIDFDKGAIRPVGSGVWINQNMQRLLRSLRKGFLRHERFHFTDEDWETLARRHAASLRSSEVPA
jgi:3-deoxy-D-manno-octulosonic acid kinase